MAFGKTVNSVVEQYNVDIHIPAEGMNEMVSSDSHTVTIATDCPYVHLRIGNLASGSDGNGSTVDGMETITI